MSKTPFELRFDTLTFARGHLIGEYDAKASLLNYTDGGERAEIMRNLKYPSVDAVFELAERFKSFVNDQKPTTKAPELLPLDQRIAEHCGAVLTEESFKRIFPDIAYAREGLELNGEKPFSIEERRPSEFSEHVYHRVLGAYRTINSHTDKNEGREFRHSDASLEKETEEMERLLEIVKPAIEAKIVCLYEELITNAPFAPPRLPRE